MAAHYDHDMTPEDLVAQADAAAQTSDPAERAQLLTALLRELPQVAAHIRELRQRAVQELRAAGWSHQQIGDAIGVHRNRAQQIAEGRTGGTRRRAAVTDDAPEVDPDGGPSTG